MQSTPLIHGLQCVVRVVGDQQRALAIYTERLGFEDLRGHEGPHGRFLTVAPESDDRVEFVSITLEGFDDEEATRPSKPVGNDAGLIDAAEDCHGTVNTLERRGEAVIDPASTVPWGIQATDRRNRYVAGAELVTAW